MFQCSQLLLTAVKSVIDKTKHSNTEGRLGTVRHEIPTCKYELS